MAALYEINQMIEEWYQNSVDQETGEIIGDLSILDALELERDQKIENIGLLIKNINTDKKVLEAQQKAFQEEADKYGRQAKACENRIGRLKDYLLNNLHVDKFKTLKTSIWTSKHESADIIDLWKIPDEYLDYKDPVPKRAEIKKALKAGQTVEGAELKTTISITVR